MVHSVVLLDGCTGGTVGLIEQRRWTRVADDYGKSNDRKRRAYEDKESFKWQQAGQAVRERLGEALSQRAIAVCDREAHISEYLLWQQTIGGRYVVRASGDRRLCGTQSGLWDTLGQASWLGTHEVQIPQRGGRPARTAQLSVRAQRVDIACPVRLGHASIRCHALLATERAAPAGSEPVEWLLLTTETVATHEQALNILWMYSRRWRIEEFHKAWKSGTRVEELRGRSAKNLERGGSYPGLCGDPLITAARVGLSVGAALRSPAQRTFAAAMRYDPDHDRMVRVVLDDAKAQTPYRAAKR